MRARLRRTPRVLGVTEADAPESVTRSHAPRLGAPALNLRFLFSTSFSRTLPLIGLQLIIFAVSVE